MAVFKSSKNVINRPVEVVYNHLSDLRNFEGLAGRMPEELSGKVDFEVRDNYLTIKTQQIGDISFILSRKVVNQIISLETVSGSSPMPFSIEILLSADGDNTIAEVETKIELNPIFKAMVSKPIQDMTDKFAALLTIIHYQD